MTRADVALALAVNLIWGFTFATSKVGVDHFPPLFFTGLRFAVVAVVLLPFLRSLRGRLKPILAVALTVGALHFSLLYTGIFLSGGISQVAIVAQLIAPFSLILAVFMLGERIGWRRALAVTVAFSGVMVLGFDPMIFQNIDGLLVVVMAALCMAFGLILMRQLRGVGVLELQGWIGLISAPIILSISAVVETGQIDAMSNAGWLGYGALAFTAFATSIVAHGSWYYLLQKYPLSVLTPYGLLAPIFGVMCGVMMFGEPLSWRLMVGGLMTVAGVAIIHVRTGGNHDAEPKPEAGAKSKI